MKRDGIGKLLVREMIRYRAGKALPDGVRIELIGQRHLVMWSGRDNGIPISQVGWMSLSRRWVVRNVNMTSGKSN